MIKLVMFDIDGTIVDAYGSIYAALQTTLEEMGYPPTDFETAKRAVGHGIEFLLGSFVKAEDVQRAVEIYAGHTDKILGSTVKFLPGAENLLKGLHEQGVKLAIASNRPHQFSTQILKILSAHDLFHEIVCADNVPRAKPEADMLHEILKRVKVPAEEALFVGDMTVDAQTGQNAGVRTIIVTTGSSTRAEIEALSPYAVVDHLDEVGQIIRALQAA